MMPAEKFDALQFVEDLKGPTIDRAMAWLADDFVWHVPGPEDFGGGSYKGMQGLQDFADVVEKFFPEPLNVRWHRQWHAGGATILETKQEGPAVTGRVYQNDYVFVFVHDENGKVCEVREYQDIEPLRAVLEGFEEN